jgi:hypothetical protein
MSTTPSKYLCPQCLMDDQIISAVNGPTACARCHKAWWPEQLIEAKELTKQELALALGDRNHTGVLGHIRLLEDVLERTRAERDAFQRSEHQYAQAFIAVGKELAERDQMCFKTRKERDQLAVETLDHKKRAALAIKALHDVKARLVNAQYESAMCVLGLALVEVATVNKDVT